MPIDTYSTLTVIPTQHSFTFSPLPGSILLPRYKRTRAIDAIGWYLHPQPGTRRVLSRRRIMTVFAELVVLKYRRSGPFPRNRTLWGQRSPMDLGGARPTQA